VLLVVRDPRLGTMLLEQFGGTNGELAAAMQYSIQRNELRRMIPSARAYRDGGT